MRIVLMLLCLSSITLLWSCNTNAPGKGDKVDSSKLHAWSKEDENEFLAGCVDNAVLNMNEDTAYMHCKCVLMQLKAVFPSMDSAATVLMDSTKAAAYVEKCR